MPNPVLYIPHVVRIVLKAEQFNSERINALHAEYETAPISQSDVDTLAANVRDAVEASLVCWSTSVVFNDVTVTDCSGPEVVQGVATFAPGTTGSNNTPTLPSFVSSVWKLSTGLTGRSNRGRIFMFGLCENQVTDDALTSGYEADVLDYLGRLNAAINGTSGFLWAVASYVHLTSRPILSYGTDGVVRRQGKRETGKGR